MFDEGSKRTAREYLWKGDRGQVAGTEAGHCHKSLTKQQLKALSQHASSNMEVINGEPKIRPIKLARESPLYSNAFEKFFQGNGKFKQLQDMDVFASLVEMKQEINNKPKYNKAYIYVCIYTYTPSF